MPSLKGKKLSMVQSDVKGKGGPVIAPKKVGLGTQYKVSKFSFDTPDKAGGGWVKGGK